MIGGYDDTPTRWGFPDKPIEVSQRALDYLNDCVGPAEPTPQVLRAEVTVTASRLDDATQSALRAVVGQDGVTTDDTLRITHAGGFSYLDLIERRDGHPHFVDAVVYPVSYTHLTLPQSDLV